ncbi:MAG: glycosyltransferase WbuB [Acidobacteria bacterium]|nr:glycosyltransferase WbuB [Acidobacteriota bacterium]
MRIIFVNRYFHPDHSATSQMVSDLAFHLASRGHDIEAIASRQRYDDPSARLAPRETVGGVRITRVATTRFGRTFLGGRAIDYLTFYVTAWLALLTRRGVVVTMTDPPLMSIVAMFAARRRVNWIQDLFPEVAEALGVLRGVGPLRALRDLSLRTARANVVLGDRMAERVPSRAVVQHNWADGALRPIARDNDGTFVVGYSGNLGRAHDFATITGAMRLLADAPSIRFVITGGGAQLESVKEATDGLANVAFRPYQPRELLSESLSSADVHLVSLQPELEGLIVPSKIYGILAVARPAIFIGAADGEVGNMLTKNDCGVVVAPGDSAALARVIRDLASDRTRAGEMGRRGQALYESRFAPPIAFANWERILEEAARG